MLGQMIPHNASDRERSQGTSESQTDPIWAVRLPAYNRARIITRSTRNIPQWRDVRHPSESRNVEWRRAPYHRVAEMWFENAEHMGQSISSPEGEATSRDLPNFATGDVTFLFSEVEV